MEFPEKEKIPINYDKQMFSHFTFCMSMKQFLKHFYQLWHQYFGNSSIADITPILDVKNVKNLQQKLVHTRNL